MTAREGSEFGALLRRLREDAGLTQEALAARAGISVRGISDLERGVNQVARSETTRRLAEALDLSPEDRTRLIQAGRAPLEPARPGAASLHHAGPATPLIGRAVELATLLDLLAQSDARLITLTGPGGIGKTRLALEAAARSADHYPAGVWFIELAPLSDPALIGSAMAQALGVHAGATDTIEDALAAHLRTSRALLLLDNFEHVLPGAPLVTSLLTRCPAITILVTSRAALRLRGERAVAVPTLALPDLEQLDAEGRQVAAVGLFVERFRAVQPDFCLTPENIGAVAEICIRLDGLPLAIELAASRGNVLSPAELLDRLENRFDVLTGGPRDAPQRLRTMSDAIAWSYDLLTLEAQTLFRRLSVFAGGMTLDAALWVAGAGNWNLEPFLPGPHSAEHDPLRVAPAAVDLAGALDHMSSLVERSLVQRHESGGNETRLRMLETVRQFARMRLKESGDERATRDRHAAYFIALAELAEPHTRVGNQGEWLGRLEREHDNLRAALEWAIGREDTETALRLCGALARFWLLRGYLSEGRRWGAQSLAQIGGSPRARANASYGQGKLAYWQGETIAAEGHYQQSLAHYRATVDERGMAMTLNSLGTIADDFGEYDRAQAYHQESLHLWERIGEPWGAAHTLCDMANIAKVQGRAAEAVPLYERSLSLFTDLDDRHGIAVVLDNLGEVAMRVGDYDRAESLLEEAGSIKRHLGHLPGLAEYLDKLGMVKLAQGHVDEAEALHEESLAGQRQLGDRRGIAMSLMRLGDVARERGNASQAAAHYRESLRLRHSARFLAGVVACLEGLAGVAATQRPEEAARLYGAAAAARDARGIPPAALKWGAYARGIAAASTQLGHPAFGRAWLSGYQQPLDDIVAMALRDGTQDPQE